jgi:hypothetical protein
VGVEKPFVELELVDSARFLLDRIEAEPGYGMVTVYVHGGGDDGPDALVIPVGSIRRIELRKVAEQDVGVGFSVPRPA